MLELLTKADAEPKAAPTDAELREQAKALGITLGRKAKRTEPIKVASFEC
jgi:hypothetical protein